MKRITRSVVSLILTALILAGCGGRKNKTITIASKSFTENILLSEMYAQLIERHTDIEVIRLQPYGSTAVCFTAIENGEIDMYVDYTGTVYSEILNLGGETELNASEIYDAVKSELETGKGIEIFPPPGLNNTYALAMREDKADAFGVETMSDLRSVANRLVFGANSLFYSRVSDGYETMLAKYGLDFGSNVKMDTDLLYEAVRNGNVDVMVVYATDSQLAEYNMVLLEDDLKMFPVYEAVPLVRESVLKEYPELRDIFDMLGGLIDDRTMQSLNYRVDMENIPPYDVARGFLNEVIPEAGR